LSSHDPQTRGGQLARVADAKLQTFLGADYRRPFDAARAAYAPIRTAYLEACHGGDHRSCWMVSQLYDWTTEQPDPRADDSVVRDCISGDLMSCRAIDPLRSPSVVAPGMAGRTLGCVSTTPCDRGELRNECTRGFPRSCGVLAVIESETSPQGSVDQQRTYDLALDGCRRGLVWECRFLESGTDRYRAFAASEICRMTAHECVSAARIVGWATTAARDLTEHECQFSRASDRSSCVVLVSRYQRRVWAEPVPNRFVDLRDWLCQQKNPLVDDDICNGADLEHVVTGR
jgi:hypothetical protein